ncbi:MAG: adenylate/guanylate cyclase domain-containing protein [Actinomycetota bacterium]|nr:adenylate/guanylate cyclase domain-containing protein [Actinomycetota bacterium]
MAEHGAIVFTDIVGFTALTDTHGDDVALALLERQEGMVRAALPLTARVVKELGDGLLLWFDDPREAIDTCLRLQRDFDAVNEAADAGPLSAIADVGNVPLWVRMGVHWGCPRRRGDDIVGRDVNLAARIVDLAGPGEVLCSEATADVIGERAGVGFEPLGPVFVRGLTEPVPIVRVLSAGGEGCDPGSGSECGDRTDGRARDRSLR